MNKPSHLLSLFFVLLLSPAVTFSAPLNLSNAPLYLGGSAEPNIMFILDDSGSMMFEITPDELAFLINSPQSITGFVYPRANSVYGSDYSQSFVQVATVDDNNAYNARTRSPQFNASYYNPSVTYNPWTRYNNNLFPAASITCARHNPLNTGACPTESVNANARNLTVVNSNYNSNQWRTCNSSGTCSSTTNTKNFWPATYFWHNSGDGWSWNHYTKVEIRSSITSYTGHGRINRSECSNGTCTYDQEIQNFANWYTYYRSRVLSSRAGIGKAFATQSESKRIGYGAINKASSSVDGQNTSTIVRGIRPFLGDDREAFFSELYGRDIPASGTPLRKALDDAGQYYSRTGDASPWSTTPGESGGEDLQCRQSYSILMTDGYWSGTSTFQASTADARANVDGSQGPDITGPKGQTYKYNPKTPFSDNRANTLADVAMYYWNRDLRPDMENKVPKTARNEAFWQHMVTYGVSFGVSGSISKEDAWAAVAASKTDSPITITWPDPDAANSNCTGNACAARLDDLLHAAINGRGDLFSADDPETFAESISAILSNISDETSSASSVALNSGSISSDSLVFQARFNSGDWTGQLLAFPIIDDSGEANFGELSSPAAWDARNSIPAANARIIITSNGSQGQPFRWDNLSAEQRLLLNNDEPTLDYLRGVRTGEQSNQGGTFRNRNFLLGDIINSAPAYVGAPIQRYPDTWGTGAPENTSPYSSFKATNSNRQPLVYVGANDGMLHAFNAEKDGVGAEWFAFVPASVYPNLPSLANPNYTHKYFVDGSPTVVDAFIEGEWRTILVSGLGGGGQGIFALDVTNPADFLDEETAASKVLWEFTDEYVDGLKNGKDLGFTYGQPSIVRLQNGEWAAVFSGGYNNTVDNNGDGNADADSSSGNAVLFIVRLSDGELIETIDTEVGAEQDPTGQNRPNGLASPAAVDIDGDFIVDYVYAGDLFGNMWKFDLTGNSPEDWGVAYKNGGSPRPLYQACSITAAYDECPVSNLQPITTRPQVVRHPTSNGFLVLFGTGKYLEVDDNSIENQATQTFYAIWDKRQDPENDEYSLVSRSTLLQQEITHEGTRSEIDGRDLEGIATDSTEYRVTSDNSINWSNDLGWYVDLISPNTANNYGERQVSNSIVRNGRIIFTTLLPSSDPCDAGGSGWLMELNYATGARLSYSPFDITGEGIFNEEDFICIANCELDGDGNPDPNRVLIPVSGKKSDVGIIPTPSIASEAGGQREFKYTSGSSGNIEVTVENPGPGFEGRQSWRQLDFLFR
ncbi:pilus assembly protein [Methylophaga sp.]|uniref:pilus assembly protein n=1 Tax=Methylophaga sp. TaxID=2024840 RepID=UPI00271B5AED|nr:PilC/PilY family type IV pilus protein [Methylophaga sp.]MDO8825283.1 PilC/PilY family type IV pilus protein [Methylophaga sp.]